MSKKTNRQKEKFKKKHVQKTNLTKSEFSKKKCPKKQLIFFYQFSPAKDCRIDRLDLQSLMRHREK